MRLSKQLVFRAMTFLNSIGDYKHPEVSRYREAYEKTTFQLTRLLQFMEIDGEFDLVGLTSLYMSKERVAKLTKD